MVGGRAWHGLLTSLIGLAIARGFVWLIRIAAGVASGREAMGFGDVTLMAMIGAFLGWQAGTMVVWFFAPLAAVVFALGSLLMRKMELPFGPYLCGGATIAIFRWDSTWSKWASIWTDLEFIFGPGGGLLMPVGGLFLVVLLAVMLGCVFFVKRLLLNAPIASE